MGRWINKIPSDRAPSKPTKLGFDGFDGTHYGDIAKKIPEADHATLLARFVRESCLELQIDPQLIIDALLSVEDEQDILEGHISTKQLSYIIGLWVKSGMRHVSGKNAVVNIKR